MYVYMMYTHTHIHTVYVCMRGIPRLAEFSAGLAGLAAAPGPGGPRGTQIDR